MLNHAGFELGPILKGGGILLGSIALTFRGFGNEDFQRVADVLDYTFQVARAWDVANIARDGQQSGGGLGERRRIEREADVTSLKQEVKILIDTQERRG